MSYRGREIEIKLQVDGMSLAEVNAELLSLYSDTKTRMVYGKSTDTYWHLPGEVGADFARMRELGDGRTQLTVKAEDKGNNIDRLEIDVDTYTAPSRVLRLMKNMLGKPAGKITKEYYVYWISEDEHTNVSCYAISDMAKNSVFIEVESTSESQVLELELKILDKLTDKVSSIGRAEGSLYTMFIKNGGVIND